MILLLPSENEQRKKISSTPRGGRGGRIHHQSSRGGLGCSSFSLIKLVSFFVGCIVTLFIPWKSDESGTGTATTTTESIINEATKLSTSMMKSYAGSVSNSDGRSLSQTTADSITTSLNKLYKAVDEQKVVNFDKNNPIFLDIGLFEGDASAYYLQKGYSVAAVEAYNGHVEKAQERFRKDMILNKFLLYNIAVGNTNNQESEVPLYYKKEGSVIASLVRRKGCQMAEHEPMCKWVKVPVVPCETILQSLGVAPQLMSVQLNMMEHSCIRGLHRLNNPELLPKQVCWLEHDKQFGDASLGIARPLTDIKLVLGMYELGYETMKVIVRGRGDHAYYGYQSKDEKPVLYDPNAAMHFRKYEDHLVEDATMRTFDTDWVAVETVLAAGLYNFGVKPRPSKSAYFEICMELSEFANEIRTYRKDNPDSVPLSSFA